MAFNFRTKLSDIRYGCSGEKTIPFTCRDLLADMKLAIDVLIDTAEQVKYERDNSMFTDCDYLSDEETYISESKELTKCVRKRFCTALKSLIEHGASQVRSCTTICTCYTL